MEAFQHSTTPATWQIHPKLPDCAITRRNVTCVQMGEVPIFQHYLASICRKFDEGKIRRHLFVWGAPVKNPWWSEGNNRLDVGQSWSPVRRCAERSKFVFRGFDEPSLRSSQSANNRLGSLVSDSAQNLSLSHSTIPCHLQVLVVKLIYSAKWWVPDNSKSDCLIVWLC